MLRIGVDIGGTFTDFSVWASEIDPYVSLKSFKLPTSRPHFADAVKAGIRQIFEDLGASADTPVVVVHGTALLQRIRSWVKERW